MPDTPYPLPALHFSVSWGDANNTVNLSEVSGFTLESEPIEYRGGSDITLTVGKIPGLKKYGNVTLKRDIVPQENGFWIWWNTIQPGVVERRTVTISLLDEEHKPTPITITPVPFQTRLLNGGRQRTRLGGGVKPRSYQVALAILGRQRATEPMLVSHSATASLRVSPPPPRA